MTGLHTVADLYCTVCHELVGWQYLVCHEPSQKYKEGRVILEKARISKTPIDEAAPSTETPTP